jgi:hypothetical protein
MRPRLEEWGRVYVALLLGSAAVAALVALTCAAAMRSRLRYGFAGVPHTLGQALSILAVNARIAGLVLAMALVVQLRHHQVAPARGFLAFCDICAATPAAINLGVVGVSLGAYGARMLAALLPHGPVELAAFARAGALYLQARCMPLARRHALRSGAVVLALLAAAALLETYR